MKRELFEDCIDRIFAAFGKREPECRIMEAIWERVSYFPDSFMEYAEKTLKDEDKLPTNLGKYLAIDLWPEFLGDHPELIAAKRHNCDYCDGSGYYHVWRNDDSAYNGTEYQLKCVCKAGDRGWTRAKIEETGIFTFNDPDSSQAGIEHWRKYRRKLQNVIGHTEELRPRHEEYMQNYVEF